MAGGSLDQESSEARGGAGRRSAPAGRGRSGNRPRLALASPLTPHRTVGSAWKTTQDEAEARETPWRSPTGAAVRKSQGRRAMQEKYVQRARPTNHLAASLGQGEVGRGIQDLTELVWGGAPAPRRQMSSCWH